MLTPVLIPKMLGWTVLSVSAFYGSALPTYVYIKCINIIMLCIHRYYILWRWYQTTWWFKHLGGPSWNLYVRYLGHYWWWSMDNRKCTSCLQTVGLPDWRFVHTTVESPYNASFSSHFKGHTAMPTLVVELVPSTSMMFPVWDQSPD